MTVVVVLLAFRCVVLVALGLFAFHISRSKP